MKTRGISRLDERLLYSLKGLCSVELIICFCLLMFRFCMLSDVMYAVTKGRNLNTSNNMLYRYNYMYLDKTKVPLTFKWGI
jgi:hypothetical protein